MQLSHILETRGHLGLRTSPASTKPLPKRTISQKSRCIGRRFEQTTVRVAAPEAPEAFSPTQEQPTDLVQVSDAGSNIVYKTWQEQPQQKIPGSTILITGGSQGVGRALAIRCAKAGFNVIIASRNPSTLEEAGKAAYASNSTKPPAVMAVSVDITNENAVKSLAQTASEMFEDVTVLVNNAGVCATGAFEDTPIDSARNIMEINFTGHMIMTQAMLPMLRASALRAKTRQGSPGANVPGPAIVMVNSFAARIPLKNMSAYTASKYALIGFTDVLRDELQGSGIFVGTVNPGVIKSNFLERAQWYGKQGDKARETMNTMMEQAGGLVQTPEEVASAVFDCIVKQQQAEVNVGPVFNGAIQGYRLTGFNPFALAP